MKFPIKDFFMFCALSLIGNNIPNEIKHNDASMVKTLRDNEISYQICASLRYVDINLIQIKFFFKYSLFN